MDLESTISSAKSLKSNPWRYPQLFPPKPLTDSTFQVLSYINNIKHLLLIIDNKSLA